MLAYSAQRILELCESMQISQKTQEEIWEGFKYLLSECTEILVGRHIDQLVLCTIFGVCKINSPISFKKLVEEYDGLFPNDERIH